MNNDQYNVFLENIANGARPTLKYLRQVSRRAGAANGEIKRQIAYDWEDYIRMAKKVGVDLKVESNRYPLQLARRHNEMMAVIREKDAAASAERRREMAVSLDKKFGVAKVMKRIRKLYEYKGERYSIIVPADVFDIVKDSTFLGHCVACSCGRRTSRTVRGTRWKSNPAARFGRSARIPTSSIPICKRPFRS